MRDSRYFRNGTYPPALFSKVALTQNPRRGVIRAWSLSGPKESFEGQSTFYSYLDDTHRKIAYWPDQQLITSIHLEGDSLILESTLLLKNGAQCFARSILENFYEVTPESFKSSLDAYAELWESQTGEWKLVELLDDSYFVELNLSSKEQPSRWKNLKRILGDRFGTDLSMTLAEGSNGTTLYFPVTKDDADFLALTLAKLGGETRSTEVKRGKTLVLGPKNSTVDFLHFGRKSKSIIQRMKAAGRTVHRCTSGQLRTMILDPTKPWPPRASHGEDEP
ncbi:MAG: hypothetical protein FJ308_15490 [Planctomycetes bacterium]|nr:hypothetical protein [Planctomycetota bacterium]